MPMSCQKSNRLSFNWDRGTAGVRTSTIKWHTSTGTYIRMEISASVPWVADFFLFSLLLCPLRSPVTHLSHVPNRQSLSVSGCGRTAVVFSCVNYRSCALSIKHAAQSERAACSSNTPHSDVCNSSPLVPLYSNSPLFIHSYCFGKDKEEEVLPHLVAMETWTYCNLCVPYCEI